MPTFADCESSENRECTVDKLGEYFSNNIKTTLLNGNGETSVTFDFIVDTNGKVDSANIIYTTDTMLASKISKLVEAFNLLKSGWRAGYIDGIPVNVRFTLAFDYNIEINAGPELNLLRVTELDGQTVLIKRPPRFPGCENMAGTEKEKESCANMKMLNYIFKNLSYPPSAKENGVQGMVVTSFIVNANGELSDYNVVKSLNEDCDKAALKAIMKFDDLKDKWIPALDYKGEKVSSLYYLPIRFRLQ
jgi:TonB family protein